MPFKSICLPALTLVMATAAFPAEAMQMRPEWTPNPAAQAPSAGPGYAEIADLVIASPVVMDVTIVSTVRIKGAEAASVLPGYSRYYIEADVNALVRGPGAVPPRVGYVLDAPLGQDGRQPKLKRARALLFARPVPGSPTQFQLINPSAQRLWSAEIDGLTRRIAGEMVASDAPPVVIGVGNAFHVPGSLPGEGETQVFLTTQDNRPVSLSILRRPGERPRWAVALSEIVDDSAGPPQRDTLLWYRLACFLPRTLPARSTQALETADAAVAQEDYRLVIEELGSCRRP